MKAENKTRVILEAELPVYGGLSIGKWKGKVVLIKGAVPGEIIEAVLEEERRDYCTASAIRVLNPSPYRVEPKCKFFGLCGGCQLQYIEYNYQVKTKEETLKDCLKRLAKIETDLSESLIHDNPWNYRYRGQFKTSRGKIGFYKEKAREVIDIDNCPLMTEEINEHLAKARPLLRGIALKEIHISCGDKAIALIKTEGRQFVGWDELSSVFLRSGFSGLVIELGGKRLLKYGSRHITLDLEGLKYTISPMSFFQSHWRLNQSVVRFVKDSLQPLKGKRVLDLYSGAGNFSIPLAVDADEVIAVEENPYAINDGRLNLEINGIENLRFIHSSVEALHIRDHIDVLIVDPPRPGLTNISLSKILAIAPWVIVYVSCNPTTLARDLKKLLTKYEIESITMIDFFPQTYHIESLTLLRLK